MKNISFYIKLVAVIGVTLLAVSIFPLGDLFMQLASIPIVGSLCLALWQIFRDQVSHERQVQLQTGQQVFNLGATSHMANTVFDKHVEFSEQYLSMVDELVVTLTREGPTDSVFAHSRKLHELRQKFSAWITPDIETKLVPFENAILKMGGNAHLQKMIGDPSQQNIRKQAVDEMYKIFSQVLEIGGNNQVNEEITVRVVKQKIREILGIDDLVFIRKYLISQAALAAGKK